MDEDQNNYLSDGQLGQSVGISQYVVVEERQNLEQLEVNYDEGIRTLKLNGF